MKLLLLAALLCSGGALLTGAEQTAFSKALRAEDFSAAGLQKLSPAELERLDALVRDFGRGALQPVPRPSESASAAARAEPVAKSAEPARTAKPEAGMLSKAKVLLTPGTKVEYAAVESRLRGEFRGWDAHTTFTLENGQRWQAVGGDSYVGPAIAAPVVKILPGMLGSFWMTIDGVRQRVKVKPVGGAADR